MPLFIMRARITLVARLYRRSFSIPHAGQTRRRYIVYIEAEAWATNLKHKLASGSLLFTPGMRHAEFFGRALEPHVHHVPLGIKRMCQELVDQVRVPRASELRFWSAVESRARARVRPTMVISLLGQKHRALTAPPWLMVPLHMASGARGFHGPDVHAADPHLATLATQDRGDAQTGTKISCLPANHGSLPHEKL